MELVRLEHKDTHKGFFRSDGAIYAYLSEGRSFEEYEELKEVYYNLCVKHNDSFPIPRFDGLADVMDSNMHCGFKSIPQMQEWINPKEMDMLIKGGILVFIINADVVYEGGQQMIFDITTVTSKQDITNLFTS